jgi:hypothetical protein
MIPSCARNFPVPESVREIFMEGAYVVAAHQYLRLHGRCGYVDGRGELNPEFADTETRIDAFRGLGAAVVARQLSPQSHEKVGADHGLENPLA